MGSLVYTAIGTLDGYVADVGSNFDWAAPDEQVHAFLNDLERKVGTYLYGRRMYEVMFAWESEDIATGQPPVVADYAGIWRAAEKIVYSTTLERVRSTRTRLERAFDPDEVRRLKVLSESDVSVGGPTLAAEALRAGLVDECRLFLAPVVVGGGIPVFPDRLRVNLELLDERRFAGGMVYLRYRVTP